jgi:YVTN family beta-propeller protein
MLIRSLLAVAVFGVGMLSEASAQLYRSPQAVAVAPDGKRLYVADKTANCVVVLDLAAGKAVREIAIPNEPNGLVLSVDGSKLFVAERKAHAVAVIDTAAGKVAGRISVGSWPVAVTLAESNKRLYTCNRGDDSVSIVDLAPGKEIKRIQVVREPACAAVTPDGTRIVVSNFLPQGAGTDPALSSLVSILDAARQEQIATVKLPPGSTTVSGVAMSPNGKWAYVVHSLGRFTLPITQLERGWVHTYAMSIIDVKAASLYATVLLDDLVSGAADPWAVVCSADGKTVWVSHAGTHEVSILDIGRLHDLLEGRLPPELAQVKEAVRDNIWVRISQNRGEIPQLANDLTALYIAGVLRRVPSGGEGPRGLTVAPDGQRLYVTNYFSGTVASLDSASGKTLGSIAVGPQPKANAARRGELYFYDARRCFQRWHSCASCHPDGRVDALPWDFMRDGIGNGKDVINLAGIQHTSPHNRRATRPDPRECMRTGVIGSHLIVPQPDDVDDLLAYVVSLQPEINPRSPQLGEAARRGKAIFEGKAGCAYCHPAPYFTDGKMHNVGMITPSEPDGKYDTPSLIEAYRTAPYYHDGRAATLKEALTTSDHDGKHGHTKDLTPQELDDLTAYVLSL